MTKRRAVRSRAKSATTPRRGSPNRRGSSARRGDARLAATRRRRLQAVAFGVFGAAVLAGVIVLAADRHNSTTGFDTAPTAFVLPALESSGKVALSDYRGRPVVVNFFASWCTQCAAELPVFDADARALQAKVAFVEVNAEETGSGRDFADHYGLAASVTAVARDVGGSQADGLYQALGGNGSMPMTAFYGADGHLLTTHVGAFDGPSLAAALQQLYGINV